MSKRSISQQVKADQKVNEQSTKEQQIETLLEVQRMYLQRFMELNGAIDEVFRTLIIEPDEVKIIPGKGNEMLHALYNLYIKRYGIDPKTEGIIMPQDLDGIIPQKSKIKTND